MKLLHWNVHMWRTSDDAINVQPVGDLLSQVSPDVVSFVEVDEPWGQPVRLRQLADELGYCWAYVPAFEYRQQGGFGNALMSRTPIRAVQQWDLLTPRLYDGTEPSEQRTVLLAKVEADGLSLWVGSTHLPRNEPAMRAEASRRLLDILAGLDGPWIVSGDFNQPPSAWLSDTAAAVAPNPSVPTHPADAPTESVDYALFTGVAAEAQALHSEASDHLPLVIGISSLTPPSQLG